MGDIIPGSILNSNNLFFETIFLKPTVDLVRGRKSYSAEPEDSIERNGDGLVLGRYLARLRKIRTKECGIVPYTANNNASFWFVVLD